jgi:hypothetical protein
VVANRVNETGAMRNVLSDWYFGDREELVEGTYDRRNPVRATT